MHTSAQLSSSHACNICNIEFDLKFDLRSHMQRHHDLWLLCKVGNLKEVRAALARGEDVNSKDDVYSSTGLMWAVERQRNSIVRLLLEQPAVDLNCTNSCGETALHSAVEFGNIEAVQLLLADPRLTTANLNNNYDETAVTLAITNENKDALLKLALHHSVDLDTRDLQGRSLEEVAR